MKRILALTAALCFAFILFSVSTDVVSGNRRYYHRQMIQNDIPKVTGKSLSQLDEISDGLIDYLKRGDEKAIAPYFSKSEVDHMVDVYALFSLMRELTVAAVFAGGGSFAWLVKRVGCRESLRKIGKATMAIIVTFCVLGLAVAMNFTKAWYTFHTLFFSNRLWLMDPEKDLMIQMLPENFFFGMVKEIGLAMAVGLFALGSLAFLKGDKNDTE